MTATQANVVSRIRRAHVVLVAGVAETGKTTLMASLFDRYQRGPFGGFRFRGSRTLVGFEERCFFSRLASGRRSFTTPRTTLTGGAELLHLDLEDVADGSRSTLLLPDLPAERYSVVIDDVAEWRNLPAVDRVDRVAVLVDGKRLADDATKWEALAQAQTLARGAIESGVATAETLDLAITKWDEVAKLDAEVAVRESAAGLRDAVVRFTSSSLPDVVECASRSVAPEATVSGAGLDILLRRWLTPRSPEPRQLPAPLRGKRAFSSFGATTP
jgi:hypothetical protein